MRNQYEGVILRFPISKWLSAITKVHDSGGANITIDCPVCKGRRKLAINRVTKLSQCFKCRAGFGRSEWDGTANLPKLIQVLTGVSYSQAWAIIFRESAGSSDIVLAPTAQEQTWSRPDDEVPAWSLSPQNDAIVALHRRGLTHLIRHITVCFSGKYRYRWILPCRYFEQELGWEAKSFVGHEPKSLFPSWFRTSQAIYTTYQWDKSADFAVVTESIFDAETLGCNAIGLFGSELSDGQLAKLVQLRNTGITRLVWFLDADAIIKQAKAIVRKTSIFFENLVVNVPQGQDPNQLGRNTCWKLVSEARSFSSANLLNA